MEVNRNERRLYAAVKALLLILTVISACFAFQKEASYAADPAYVTIKVKVQDAVNKTPLEGRKIELRNKSNGVAILENGNSLYGGSYIESITGSDGIAVFSGIPVDCEDRDGDVLQCQYSISYNSSYVPFSDPYYYQKSEDVASIDVTPVDGEKPDNIYEYTYSLKKKVEYVKVRVKKVDAITREPLKGAGIDVINGGMFGGEIVLADGTKVPHGGVIQHIVTDENGIAETDQIIPNTGQFYIEVVETEAPEGYFLDERSWRVYGSGPYPLWAGEYIYDVTVRNYPLSENGGISLEKLFVLGDEGDTADFEITLNDKNGDPVNGSFDMQLVYQDLSQITFVDGKAKLTVDASDGYKTYRILNIPAGYSYEVRELPAEGWRPLGDAVMKGTIEANASHSNGEPTLNNRLQYVNIKDDSPKAASFSLQAEKRMQNKKLDEGEYTFELKQDGKLIDTARNDKDGKVSFKSIDIDPEDIRSEVKYMEATDEQKSMVKEWISVTRMPYNSAVTIFTDNIPGDASAYLYVEDPYSSWGGDYIRVYYKDATDEQKKQAIEDSRIWVLDDNDNAGFQSIDAIDGMLDSFKETLIGFYYDKTITYTINEVLPEGVSDSSPKKDGITYDTHKEEVKVHISGDAGGELKATVSYDEDGPAFSNKYEEELKQEKVTTTDETNKEPAPKDTVDTESKDEVSEPETDDEDSSSGDQNDDVSDNDDGSDDESGEVEESKKKAGYKGVKTGDDQSVMSYILLFAISVLLLASLVRKHSES